MSIDPAADLVFREVRESDLRILFEQQSDPVALEMAAFTPRSESEFWEHWRRNILGDPAVYKRALIVGGQVVGHVACFERDGVREVAYWIAREQWGRGIATRALRQLLADVPERPLHAVIAPGNVASMRVLEKCGFRLEQKRRGDCNGRGPEQDELVLRVD